MKAHARSWLLGCALAALAAGLPRAAQAQGWSAPVTCSGCITDYYYVDQGFSQDWNCGDSTYSDHTGTDYSLRNGNFAIDDDNEVVAMASGVVVSSQDGYYDRCTQCGGFNCGTSQGNGFANQVIINHGPHRVIYGHMKEGSIAVKQGDMVTCGQVIGFIGSSGCSTGAHLHIEPSVAADFGVRPYTYLDPYAGDCGSNDASFWADQGGYRVLPGSACEGQPAVPACPAETYPIWTCLADGSARKRCVDGVVTEEPCPGGCSVMPPGTDDVCALPPDADGDGSRSDVDCDDANGALHPGAMEVCGDAIDQDCSGADLMCPVPPPVAGAGSGGTGGAAGLGASGSGGAGGAPGAPGLLEPGMAGSASQPIEPVGQAQAGAAGIAPVVPLLPMPGAEPPVEEAGCRVAGVGMPTGGRSGAWWSRPGMGVLLLLAVRRRRMRRWIPSLRA